MKKFKLLTFILVLLSIVFIGMPKAMAATSIPESVKSDDYKIIEYIDNFRVVTKTVDNGSYYVYCINLEATYDKEITFSKKSTVNEGFLYILNNLPNTGDKDKDFYIAQMAVWYYEDYLNQNNDNLQTEVKKYLVNHKDTEEVSKAIMDLLNGAITYKQNVGVLALGKEDITFTEVNGYFVSSVIPVTTNDLTTNLKYSLTNTPVGSLVVKSGNGVKVKIPVASLEEGRQLEFSLNVEGQYLKKEAYYYYYNSNYQKVLLSEPLEKNITINDSVNMIVRHYPDTFNIKFRKTDFTQEKIVAGATLIVKDTEGNVIDTWVSTNEDHIINLTSGEYTLSEQSAPEGYKLSKTVISFKVDAEGKVFVKTSNNEYNEVSTVVMINELLDIVNIAKKNKKTDNYLSGAKLKITDASGNIVSEFVSTDSVYQIALVEGTYKLSEIEAPNGYILSDEVVEFEIINDGTLKVKNELGEFVDSAIIIFYNTPEETTDVPVPATDKNSTFMILSGLALLTCGIVCVKKTIKEC